MDIFAMFVQSSRFQVVAKVLVSRPFASVAITWGCETVDCNVFEPFATHFKVLIRCRS